MSEWGHPEWHGTEPYPVPDQSIWDARAAVRRKQKAVAIAATEACAVALGKMMKGSRDVGPQVLARLLDGARSPEADDCTADQVLHDLSMLAEYALDPWHDSFPVYGPATAAEAWWEGIEAMAAGDFLRAAAAAQAVVDMQKRDERWKEWRA